VGAVRARPGGGEPARVPALTRPPRGDAAGPVGRGIRAAGRPGPGPGGCAVVRAGVRPRRRTSPATGRGRRDGAGALPGRPGLHPGLLRERWGCAGGARGAVPARRRRDASQRPVVGGVGRGPGGLRGQRGVGVIDGRRSARRARPSRRGRPLVGGNAVLPRAEGDRIRHTVPGRDGPLGTGLATSAPRRAGLQRPERGDGPRSRVCRVPGRRGYLVRPARVTAGRRQTRSVPRRGEAGRRRSRHVHRRAGERPLPRHPRRPGGQPRRVHGAPRWSSGPPVRRRPARPALDRARVSRPRGRSRRERHSGCDDSAADRAAFARSDRGRRERLPGGRRREQPAAPSGRVAVHAAARAPHALAGRYHPRVPVRPRGLDRHGAPSGRLGGVGSRNVAGGVGQHDRLERREPPVGRQLRVGCAPRCRRRTNRRGGCRGGPWSDSERSGEHRTPVWADESGSSTARSGTRSRRRRARRRSGTSPSTSPARWPPRRRPPHPEGCRSESSWRRQPRW
jgi:hypothetical protein